MLWHQGLLLKLHRLNFVIDYDSVLSEEINIQRGAPQGGCFGPPTYIVAHYHSPQIYRSPDASHLYNQNILAINEKFNLLITAVVDDTFESVPAAIDKTQRLKFYG
ncbi:unnamed protein product [Didymodactylos carnosus]|uniref:Uncharacterized protein n=2 Tax=Didymodactylos carnosus TaxID=1234261 RepID=A0A814JUM4_9BILA|nr:unnamed protein product [Didymodactylos carnosus]CAF3812423.1 unnamed protein product [Didymodactylos carnosus]